MTIQQFEEHVKGFAASDVFSKDELILNFAIGLAGETGELIDLVKKHLFHGQEFNREKFVLEAGNCLFYWVALMQKLGFGEEAVGSYNDYLWVSGFSSPVRKSPASLSLKLSTRAGHIAQLIDGVGQGLVIDPKSIELFDLYIETWFALLKFFSITPEEAMRANESKLQNRHQGKSFDRAAAIRNKPLED